MAPASEIFAPDLLRDRVALVTGGGTNLGARRPASCWPAARASSSPAAGPTSSRTPSRTWARRGERGRRRRPRSRRCGRDRGGAARAPRSARRPRQQRRRPVLRPRRGHQRQGLGRRPAPERRRDRDDDAGGPRRSRWVRPATAGRSSTSPSRPITGCPRWRTRARPAPRSRRYGRELAAELAPRGIAVVSAAIGRFATESLKKYPAVVQAGRPAASRCSGWGRCASSPGSWPCWPRRSGARSAARWSPSTAGGRLVRPLAAAGARRGRRRRARPRTAVRQPPEVPSGHRDGLAGEVLWLHRSLPSSEGGFDSRRPL